MPNLLRVCHLQHLLCQRRQLKVFRPLPRWDEVVNVPVLCHPCSLLLKYQYSLLLAPLLHTHDLRDTCYLEESFLRYRFQIQLVPAFLDDAALLTRDGLGYVLDCTVESTRCHVTEALGAHELPGSPLGLSPFSRHRSVKKQLAASLAS